MSDSYERNPDAGLIAKFYTRPVQNNFKSEQEARAIFEDVDYVIIYTPGDNLNIPDVPVRSDHKERFPVQWARYKESKDGNTEEIGTPLSQWPRLSLSQIEELKALKFFTVESIAKASDAALSSIGMIAGTSPFKFRDMATQFLKIASDDSHVTKVENEKKQMAEIMAEQRRQLDKVMAEMQELSKRKPSKNAVPEDNV